MATDDNQQHLNTNHKHEPTQSVEELMLKKSIRRFDKNEGKWSTLKPKATTIRAESSKAMTIRDINLSGDKKSFLTLRATPSNEKHLTKNTAKRSIHKVEKNKQKIDFRNKLADFIDYMKDSYRRLTEPDNYDPYVKVTLKPTPSTNIEKSFKTAVIYGGGSNVAWNEFADENHYTFLLYNKPDALKLKYLKIEVFDYESGSADQSLGAAYIELNSLQLSKKNYAVLDLYESNISTGYAWGGTVEISATFKKLSIYEAEQIKQDITQDIERKMNEKMNTSNPMKAMKQFKNRKRGRSRGITDQLVMDRFGSRGTITMDNSILKSRKNLELMEKEKEKYKQDSEGVNSVRGRITLLVLFTSLILSGTLFFGAMDLYEVDLQRVFYKLNYDSTFSLLDSFHWSFVTVSTIGYGDLYPQTTGGKIFGSFFIVFGVSLLGRLLNFVLEYENGKFLDDMKRRQTFRKKMTWGQMVEWDVDGDGTISKYEFLRGMLIKRDDTKVEFINQIMDIFNEYDADNSGEIEIDEMKVIMAKKAKEMQNKIKKKQMGRDNENKKNKYCNYCCCFKHENKQDDIQDTIEESENEMDINENENENDEDDFYAIEIMDEFDDNEPFEYGLEIEVHGCDNLKTEHADFEDSLKTFVISIFGFMLWLIVFALIFSIVENANFGDMLWFCVVTACTVGYGDQHPQSSIGRIINAFFIAISVVLFLIFFGTAFDFLYKKQEVLVNQKRKKKNDMSVMIDNFHFKTLERALNKSDENDTCKKNKNDINKNLKTMKKKKTKSRLQLILDDNNEEEEKDNSEDSYLGLWDALNSATPSENKKVDLQKLDAMKSSKNLGLLIDDKMDDDHNEYMIRAKSHIGSVISDINNINNTPISPTVETIKLNQNVDVMSLCSNSGDNNNDQNEVKNDENVQRKMDPEKSNSFDIENDEQEALLVTKIGNIIDKNDKGYEPVETNDNINEYVD